jgi:hypothetical protein
MVFADSIFRWSMQQDLHRKEGFKHMKIRPINDRILGIMES